MVRMEWDSKWNILAWFLTLSEHPMHAYHCLTPVIQEALGPLRIGPLVRSPHRCLSVWVTEPTEFNLSISQMRTSRPEVGEELGRTPRSCRSKCGNCSQSDSWPPALPLPWASGPCGRGHGVAGARLPWHSSHRAEAQEGRAGLRRASECVEMSPHPRNEAWPLQCVCSGPFGSRPCSEKGKEAKTRQRLITSDNRKLGSGNKKGV